MVYTHVGHKMTPLNVQNFAVKPLACGSCGVGRGALPSNGVLGMFRWIGSHFHDLADYNAVTLSMEVLEWGRTFSEL